MNKNIKLLQLYLLPFLFILATLGFEQGKILYKKSQSFSQIVNGSTALSQIDTENMTSAFVKKVVDGDTIELENGQKVRYIGVDTPETKHPKKPVQCFGREASSVNKGLVEGRTVLLEKDVSETDRYGRLLRYIYIPNPEATDEALFVNEYMLEQGYATVITYPPDVKYHGLFRDAEKKAREASVGLWNKCKSSGTTQ